MKINYRVPFAKCFFSINKHTVQRSFLHKNSIEQNYEGYLMKILVALVVDRWLF